MIHTRILDGTCPWSETAMRLQAKAIRQSDLFATDDIDLCHPDLKTSHTKKDQLFGGKSGSIVKTGV